MRTILILIAALATAISARAQQTSQQSESKSELRATTTIDAQNQKEAQHVVVLSGVAVTAKIANPDDKIVFNGQVMRMADFVAAVSSNTEAVQRLRNQEKHSRETAPPTPQSKP